MTSGTHVFRTMEAVLNFVKIIEQYPCLYNNTLPDYSRKDIVDKAWNEVAETMQWTVHYCQSKWKNIRNGFVRSLKLCADGSSKKQKKLYYLHNELQFILPYIKTNIHLEELGNSSPQDASREEAYSPFEEESLISPENVSSPAVVSNKKPKYRKIETEVDWLKEREFSKDDSRKMFLFSLLPDVETLSDEQMRDFRIKVLLLLEEVRTTPSQNNFSQHQRQYQQYKNSLQYPLESTLSMLKTEMSEEASVCYPMLRLSDEQMRDYRIKVLLLLEEVRTSPSQNNFSQHQRQYQQYRNSLQYPLESTLSMLKTEMSEEAGDTN